MSHLVIKPEATKLIQAMDQNHQMQIHHQKNRKQIQIKNQIVSAKTSELEIWNANTSNALSRVLVSKNISQPILKIIF